jgi:WD40 repeat protein
MGHQGPVNAIQLKGDYLVSASSDALIKLWEVSTGNLIREFAGHKHGLACVQFDGKTIVSGSNDHTIRVWDAEVNNRLKKKYTRFCICSYVVS